MPNAVDNFSNFYAQYRRTPAPVVPVAPSVTQAPPYNPYASTYQPSTPAYVSNNAPGPLSSTLGSLRGVVNNQSYNDFVDHKAPVIDMLLPLIGGVVGLFTGNKTSSGSTAPMSTAPTYPQPTAPTYPQPTAPAYPQSTAPTYPQPSYPAAYPQAAPSNQGNWSVQVNQGLQGLAGLINTIGGLFK